MLEIESRREKIDEIDARIIALIKARQKASWDVQRLRRQAGGPQSDSSRESSIMVTYENALGQRGAGIAMEILAACRMQPLPRR
ncbi:chorismate mutase [Streptomyces sp. NPDC051636]|uniref:chorismate mutase n=1 Tax=Streptomyces sp. NPDC051636 TaxID=3365663 RepID=UPI0037A9CAAA